MGANFVEMHYKTGLSVSELRDKFESDQEDDRYENGHSYSGGIGMAAGLKARNDVTFKTEDEAREWLIDTAQKWEEAIAVKTTGDDPKWIVGAWCSS